MSSPIKLLHNPAWPSHGEVFSADFFATPFPTRLCEPHTAWAITAQDSTDGSPLARLTINANPIFFEPQPSPLDIAILDTNNYKASAFSFLFSAGVLSGLLLGQVSSGYCIYPVYAFSPPTQTELFLVYRVSDFADTVVGVFSTLRNAISYTDTLAQTEMDTNYIYQVFKHLLDQEAPPPLSSYKLLYTTSYQPNQES